MTLVFPILLSLLLLLEFKTEFSQLRGGPSDLGASEEMKESGPQENGNVLPNTAKDAVFVASDPVPEGVLPVRGIDFNLHRDENITVVDLIEGMSNMGFQASAVGDAVRIINEMVRRHPLGHQQSTSELRFLTYSVANMEGPRHW